MKFKPFARAPLVGVASADQYIAPHPPPKSPDDCPARMTHYTQGKFLWRTRWKASMTLEDASLHWMSQGPWPYSDAQKPVTDILDDLSKIIVGGTVNINVPKGAWKPKGRNISAEDYISKLMEKVCSRTSKAVTIKQGAPGIVTCMSSTKFLKSLAKCSIRIAGKSAQKVVINRILMILLMPPKISWLL